MAFRIEAIRKDHKRHSFDCGQPFLNHYLQQFARQNHNKGIARAFVAVSDDHQSPVVGYYTLSASSQNFESIPQQHRRGLPKYPLPVAVIGELAVDHHMQGQGLADALLISAYRRIASASESMAVWAIVVDPINQQATSFYQHQGFESFIDSELVFVTMKDAATWLEEG